MNYNHWVSPSKTRSDLQAKILQSGMRSLTKDERDFWRISQMALTRETSVLPDYIYSKEI